MRRTFLAAAVAAGGVVFAACSDQRSPLPTEPPVSPNLTTSAPCPRPVELAALIVTLFAPRDLLTFALQMQNDISLKMSRGDVAGARKVVLAFIDFTVKTYYQGKLRDPNGTTPPGTDVFAVRLIDGLLCWAAVGVSTRWVSEMISQIGNDCLRHFGVNRRRAVVVQINGRAEIHWIQASN